MMAIDFNDAGRQSTGQGGEPIPEGTVAPVIIGLRQLAKSQTGARGLDLEFTVTAGPFARRKAWKWAGYEGNGSDGHKKMVEITRSFLRAILESARGIHPTDESPDAMSARSIEDWEDFDGVEFLARFGIEAAETFTDQRTGEIRTGKDKNTIYAVTPDDPDYSGFTPVKKAGKSRQLSGNGTGGVAAKTSGKPAWAG